MPSLPELRALLKLPASMKGRAITNRAIRSTPGGADLLDRLAKMDYLRIQEPANPHYAAEVGKLRAQRDQLIDDIKSGRVRISP